MTQMPQVRQRYFLGTYPLPMRVGLPHFTEPSGYYLR